jgi:uncharacterized protein YkwD
VKAILSCSVALCALALLAGCGGDGADSFASEPLSESPAPTAETASDPVPTPLTAGTRATCNLANFQAEVLERVNGNRAAGASCGSQGSFAAAAPLAWNAALTQAALVHSDDMVSANYFSHTGSDGSTASQRATAAGYVWQAFGENIAAGQPDVAAVMASWMASAGHCANIMRASFRDIGVACVSGGAGNTYRSYWTMALGSAR